MQLKQIKYKAKHNKKHIQLCPQKRKKKENYVKTIGILKHQFIGGTRKCSKRGKIHSICNKIFPNVSVKQGNFKKIIIPPIRVWFCYLFNGRPIYFHFHLCVTGIPIDLHMVYFCDSINRPGDLDF